MNRLLADLKEDHKGNITGPVKLPVDGTFTIEAILLVVDVFAESVGRPSAEVLRDLYNYRRTQA